MNDSAKFTAYCVGLLAVFGVAVAVGNAVGPVGLANAEPAEHRSATGVGDVEVASLRPVRRHDRNVAKPWRPSGLQAPGPGHQSG